MLREIGAGLVVGTDYIVVYDSHESNFQDKSIYMIFTFSNSTT
jgi:hypothetical protein